MSKLAINGGSPVRTESWPRWPQWDERERERVLGVLASGEWGGFNPVVKDFEAAFARRHEAKHCIAVTNGTASLEAALRVLGVGPGDEVIVPPYTFIATANAVRLAGATPVFADIEPDTYNLDVEQVEKAISKRTKAIIPVHFAGLPVDMDELMLVAHERELAVVEDAAHAHGSTWQGQPMGTHGDIGSFSLQQSKNLTAGEGGILITNDDELAGKLWSFVNQGRSPEGAWYEHELLGSNLRMTGWQAGILMAQMERFDEQLQRRQANARRLIEILEEIDGPSPMRWDPRANNHAFHLFMMRYSPKKFGGLPRERFVEALRAEGIPCSTGYAQPLYKQPPLAKPHSRILPCPVAEQACREAVWLTQNLLLAEPDAMEQVGRAIIKVRENVRELL
jgi:dTDP-4-amino-4,6-dideoxygalactose transaminase